MPTEDVKVMTQDDLDALWAKLKGWFVKGLSSATDGAVVAFDGTSGKLIKPLGYTPFNSANFTKANIKSTLGISDWALAASKPSYAFSEITGTVTNAQLAGSIANSKLASAGKFTIGSTAIELGTTYTAANFRSYLGLGGAATYGATSSVTDGGTSLVTSGGVYSYVNALLTAAMKIEGETTTAISDGSTTNPVTIGGQSVNAYKGMVVFYGSKEFVWVGTAWKELGDESSFALKTTTVSGTGYLTGGGALSSNQTIDIASSVKTKIDNGATAYGWGNHANAGYALASNLGTASTHAHGDYVTAISWDSTNNKLAWSKGGTAQTAITIGYATNADTVDGLHASSFYQSGKGFLQGSQTYNTNWNALFTYKSAGGAARSFLLNIEAHHNNTVINKTLHITTTLGGGAHIREFYSSNYGSKFKIRVGSADNYWRNTRVDILRVNGTDGTIRFKVISLDQGTITAVNDTNVSALSNSYEYEICNIESATVSYASSAGSATNDSDGNAINTTYLKKSGGTMTGALGISTANWENQLILNRVNNATSWGATIVFKRDGNYDTDLMAESGHLYVSGDLGSSRKKVWDEANDGAGSGLDADKLDGQEGSYFATASSVTTLQGYFDSGVAKSAAKLTTVSKTAWGRTYWTSGGVPDNISGDMSNVGNIAFQASGKNIGGTMYFDTNNHRVGINDSAPSCAFDVTGDIQASGGVAAGGILNLAYNGAGTQGTLTQIQINGRALTDTSGIVNIPLANTTSTGDGAMSHSDKLKLDGIATGATNVNTDTVAGWGYVKDATGIANALGYIAARENKKSRLVTGSEYRFQSGDNDCINIWIVSEANVNLYLPYDWDYQTPLRLIIANAYSGTVTVKYKATSGTQKIYSQSDSISLSVGRAALVEMIQFYNASVGGELTFITSTSYLQRSIT